MRTTSSVSRLGLACLALAAIALAAPLTALAQATSETPTPTAPSTLGNHDLSQSQLESFAAAATRISDITNNLQANAQGVGDQAELARLQEQANQEMVAAVEGQGLTVAEYNRIYQAAQADPEIHAMVMELLQR